MSAKHTPGPWRVEQDTTQIWGACDPSDNSTRGMGYPIAECRTTRAGNWATGPDCDEAEANARLIAAAPDLLALAYQYRNDLKYPPAPDSRERRLQAIDAAIAKATAA
jgi:hypothetical protein